MTDLPDVLTVPEQVERILEASAAHFRPLVTFMLGTGACERGGLPELG